jgi:hypothetical protein
MTSRRLGGIDILRHLLAISVIFIHTRTSLYSDETVRLSDKIIDLIDFAVLGFFLVSAYFFPFRKIGTGSTLAGSFLYSRFKRLLIPFFMFSILYAIAMALLHKATLASGIIKTLDFSGSSMQLYFLPFLYICEVLTFFLIRITKRPNQLTMLCIMLVLMSGLSLLFPSARSTGPDLHLFPLYFASFAAGVVLKTQREISVLTLATLSWFILLSVFDERLLGIAIMISLTIGAAYLSKKLTILNNAFPGSGGIYLLHTNIVNFAIAHILSITGITQIPNLLITVVLTYIFCLASSLAFIRFFGKWRFIILE